MGPFVRSLALAAVVVAGANAVPAAAVDILDVKVIGLDLARDIANEAVLSCREEGFQVSVVVVDRGGDVRAALRDDLAPRFTLQIAEEKANAVILSGSTSSEFRENRAAIRQELNHVRGILMMGGGVPIETGGSRIGAVGVSGAAGADQDEACANAALEALFDRIQFPD